MLGKFVVHVLSKPGLAVVRQVESQPWMAPLQSRVASFLNHLATGHFPLPCLIARRSWDGLLWVPWPCQQQIMIFPATLWSWMVNPRLTWSRQKCGKESCTDYNYLLPWRFLNIGHTGLLWQFDHADWPPDGAFLVCFIGFGVATLPCMYIDFDLHVRFLKKRYPHMIENCEITLLKPMGLVRVNWKDTYGT